VRRSIARWLTLGIESVQHLYVGLGGPAARWVQGAGRLSGKTRPNRALRREPSCHAGAIMPLVKRVFSCKNAKDMGGRAVSRLAASRGALFAGWSEPVS
jgi:hypothetical protein